MRRVFGASWVVFAASFVALSLIPVSHPPPPDRLERTQMDVRLLSSSVELFRRREGRYPTETEGLAALVNSDVLRWLPKDPWGGDYVYREMPGAPPFKVYSLGADRRDDRGAGDDVATLPERPSYFSYPRDPAALALLALAFFSLIVGLAGAAHSLYRWLATKRAVSA